MKTTKNTQIFISEQSLFLLYKFWYIICHAINLLLHGCSKALAKYIVSNRAINFYLCGCFDLRKYENKTVFVKSTFFEISSNIITRSCSKFLKDIKI